MIITEDPFDSSKERRAGHRERAPELLRDNQIDFTVNNGGAHLLVTYRNVYDMPRRIDFWPGTGLWIPQETGGRGRGIFKLIRYINHRRKPPCPTIEDQMKEAEEVLTKNGPSTSSGSSTP
jgi:hypothetical protein